MDISVYLPEAVLTNRMLAEKFPEWSAEKIRAKLGIESRHVAAPDETGLDMAVRACEPLLRDGRDRDIDFILYCTQSPDYPLPTTACILQDKLHLSQCLGAYDYNLGCSGYIYGLAQAKGLLTAGIARKVLLVTSETYTKYINEHDRGNRSIFGDAATATVLTSDGWRIGEFVLGTDGGGMGNLIVRNGGARSPQRPDAELHRYSNGDSTDNDLFMDGAEIFNFTLDRVPRMIAETLEKNSLTVGDVDMFVLHQANSFILETLRKAMRIPGEKFVIDMADTGNTVSSSIPLALRRAADRGDVVPGNKVLLCGFGVGYSFGAVVLTV